MAVLIVVDDDDVGRSSARMAASAHVRICTTSRALADLGYAAMISPIYGGAARYDPGFTN